MVFSEARFSHFVGREAELAYLFRGLDTMCDGGGSVVLIVSPPGRGKSRLVREFRQRLGSRAVAFALGGNLHRGQPSFSPFSEALGETFQASLFDRTSARVLVIEDLQWADDSTLELIGHVCRRIAELPMLLLLTLGTELLPDRELPPALAHLLPSLTHVLQLEPLSIADVRTLISDARDTHPTLSSEIARQIEQSCGGNPLYLEEQLRAAL
jgi:predicted ATPase